MRELSVYTAARLGVFVASYALVVGIYLLLTGGGPVPVLWPLIVAAVLSAVVSAFGLRGMRERLAQRLRDRSADRTPSSRADGGT